MIAVRDFQRQAGLAPADGYPGLAVLTACARDGEAARSHDVHHHTRWRSASWTASPYEDGRRLRRLTQRCFAGLEVLMDLSILAVFAAVPRLPALATGSRFCSSAAKSSSSGSTTKQA